MKKTNPLSVKDIEYYANRIRKEFNVDLNSYFPILDFLDYLFESKALSIQYLENDNPLLESDCPAKYSPIDNFIYIKESVLDEYENGIYRAAFTLAHELFHYIQIQVLEMDYIEKDECKPYENADWQANEFAGQLLIPTEYIECPVDFLMRKFRVSEECVLTRKLYASKRQNKNGSNS